MRAASRLEVILQEIIVQTRVRDARLPQRKKVNVNVNVNVNVVPSLSTLDTQGSVSSVHVDERRLRQRHGGANFIEMHLVQERRQHGGRMASSTTQIQSSA